MPETDFAVHTRVECGPCMNLECRCRICQGDRTNRLCKAMSDEFPMSDSCKWNSILKCNKYKSNK